MPKLWSVSHVGYIYRRLACPVAIPYARSRFSINFPEEQKTAAEAAKCLKNRLYVYDDEKIKMINKLMFFHKNKSGGWRNIQQKNDMTSMVLPSIWTSNWKVGDHTTWFCSSKREHVSNKNAPYSYIVIAGWWFQTWTLFSIIYGIILPNIFQRGWNHQLDSQKASKKTIKPSCPSWPQLSCSFLDCCASWAFPGVFFVGGSFTNTPKNWCSSNNKLYI